MSEAKQGRAVVQPKGTAIKSLIGRMRTAAICCVSRISLAYEFINSYNRLTIHLIAVFFPLEINTVIIIYMVACLNGNVTVLKELTNAPLS